MRLRSKVTSCLVAVFLTLMVIDGDTYGHVGYGAYGNGRGNPWYMRRHVQPFVVTSPPGLTWLRRPMYYHNYHIESEDREIENVLRGLMKTRQHHQPTRSNHIFLRMG